MLAHHASIVRRRQRIPLLASAAQRPNTGAKLLSQVAGAKIGEVFIGSCMTNIDHVRAASKLLAGKRDIPVKLWIAPPTKMDAAELTKEGHHGVFGTAGARTEMPSCSLRIGNQEAHADTAKGVTV